MSFGELALLFGIPTAITSSVLAFGLWVIEHRATKRDAAKQRRDDEREETRQKSLLLLVQGVDVSMDLSEATARALQSGHCNGTMDSALKRVEIYKETQQQFYQTQNAKQL